jgi:hypothetical protein
VVGTSPHLLSHQARMSRRSNVRSLSLLWSAGTAATTSTYAIIYDAEVVRRRSTTASSQSIARRKSAVCVAQKYGDVYGILSIDARAVVLRSGVRSVRSSNAQRVSSQSNGHMSLPTRILQTRSQKVRDGRQSFDDR